MSEHTKLRFSSTFVVWAARMLTMGEKVVWYHHWALDRSPVGRSNGDHCYMGAASMAERLGMSRYTIEDYRTVLRKLELLYAFRRLDATNMGWVALLPSDCEPRTDEIAGPAAVRLAAALDLYVTQKIEWLIGRSLWKPDDLSDRQRAAGRVLVRPRVGAATAPAARSAWTRGVGGSASSALDSERQAQLPPVVTDPKAEAGVGSHEPEAEDGGPGPRAIDQRPADQVTDEGFGNIRRQIRESLDTARKAAGA